MISTTVRKLLHHKWLQNALAIVFWLCVWQAVSMAVASSLILASPLAVLKTLAGLVPTAAFWHTVCESSARILAGFFWACSGGLRWRAFPPPAPLCACCCTR